MKAKNRVCFFTVSSWVPVEQGLPQGCKGIIFICLDLSHNRRQVKFSTERFCIQACNFMLFVCICYWGPPVGGLDLTGSHFKQLLLKLDMENMKYMKKSVTEKQRVLHN